MPTSITEQLKEIAHFQHKNPEAVIAEAVEIGLEKMWLNSILSQYLKKQISRRKAIQLAGLDIVRLTEHQDKAVQKDIQWGAKGAGNHR